MLRSLKSKLGLKIKHHLLGDTEKNAANSLLLLGRIGSWQVRAKETLSSLAEAEFKVSSQWGEDGIIDWLIERAQIPAHLHSFVEFGVETYREANTRFLLQNRNWRGLVMDGNPDLIKSLTKEELYWRYDVTAKTAFITRENINDLLLESGFSGELGLLSIDVDGNDYWIWEAITAVNPVLFVCEYNPIFGDVWPISIPYDATFVRTVPKFHNLYFGASIVAMQSLANRKGYKFLGTNSTGINAFFVREDYAGRFENALTNKIGMPSRHRDSRDDSGQLSFVGGLDRARLISGLPVVNTETKEVVTFEKLQPLYSTGWRAMLGGMQHKD